MDLYRCNPDDLNDVLSLGRETYYETFHSMNSSETMESYLDEAFSHEKIEAELRAPQSGFYFLYDRDSLVAYMKINRPPAQSDLNDPESLELERIYVKSGYKGSGYGRYLIEKAIAMAQEQGCRYVWLGVWEKNEKAIKFYRRMGFDVFDTHTFRMGDEIQNDFLMKIDL